MAKIVNTENGDKLFAFLGVFLGVIGFIIVLIAKKEDHYAMYYGKQGLILFVASIIVWILNLVFAFIPIIGWIIGLVLSLGIFVLWIIGVVNSFSGEEKPIPLIGHYADKINV